VLSFFDARFHKVIHFTILITGIACGLVYLKRSNQSEVLGTTDSRGTEGTDLIRGFIHGLVLLLIIESSLFVLGMRQTDPDLSNGLGSFSYVIIKALISGILVGVAEEILFRGAIFSMLARLQGKFHALTISSLFYAAVHFIDLAPLPTASDIYWLSGIEYLALSFSAFGDPGIWDSFLTLFFLGALFSMVRWETGNITQCVGLHAGIVTINKIFSYSTDYREGSPFAFLVNSNDHLTGHLASFWVVLACVFYYCFYMRKPVRSATI